MRWDSLPVYARTYYTSVTWPYSFSLFPVLLSSCPKGPAVVVSFVSFHHWQLIEPFPFLLSFRTMRQLWKTRVSPNVVYSSQHMRCDTSTLVVGGIDGVLRVLDQNTGEILTSYVMDHGTSSSSGCTHGVIERKIGKRLPHDYNIDRIPKTARPPITCLAVGMQKVITTHNSKNIRMWKFNNLRELN